MTGSLEQTEASFENILPIQADREEVYLALSDLEFQQRQYDSAAYYAQKLLTINPAQADALLLLARLDTRARRYAMALDKYNQILTLEPTNVQVRNELNQLNRSLAYRRREREKERNKIQILQPRSLKGLQIQQKPNEQ
jgi:tetratricopeptide (TPR) repeat protein